MISINTDPVSPEEVKAIMEQDKFDILLERTARIDVVLDRLEHRLFGNGQPGELQTMKDDVYHLKGLEAKGRGAFWIVSVILAVLGSGFVAHLFHLN